MPSCAGWPKAGAALEAPPPNIEGTLANVEEKGAVDEVAAALPRAGNNEVAGGGDAAVTGATGWNILVLDAAGWNGLLLDAKDKESVLKAPADCKKDDDAAVCAAVDVEEVIASAGDEVAGELMTVFCAISGELTDAEEAADSVGVFVVAAGAAQSPPVTTDVAAVGAAVAPVAGVAVVTGKDGAEITAAELAAEVELSGEAVLGTSRTAGAAVAAPNGALELVPIRNKDPSDDVRVPTPCSGVTLLPAEVEAGVLAVGNRGTAEVPSTLCLAGTENKLLCALSGDFRGTGGAVEATVSAELF